MVEVHDVVTSRYRLIESLGEGAMGRVWLARDEILHRDVAIKEIAQPPAMTEHDQTEAHRRTLQEARAAARLNHPNIIKIHDVLRSPGRSWIVMEYVRSRSLLKVLQEDGRLSPAQAARIGLAVVAALGAAHRGGVVHRDVKPSNVLIAADGRVILTDFGVASTVDTDDPGTSQSRYVLGSPGYVAPERVMDITSGPAADFWSLGATLYAAVEGRNPFTRTSLMDTLSALVNDPPDPMRHAGPLAPVVTGLLRKDPRLRMGADEVSALLHRVADSDRGELRRLVPGQRTAATANTRTDRFRARWLRTPGSPSVGAVPLPENTTTVASRDVVTVARPAGGDDATRPAAGTWSSHRRRWAALSVAVTVTAVSAALIGPAHVHPGRGSVAVSASRDAGPTDVGIAGPSTAGVAEATAPGVRPTETDGVQLPVGWGWHHETAGFRFAAPQGWFTSRANSVTYFQEPHGERLLAIGRWTPAATDPVTAWTRVEAHAAELPRYQRIRIDAVPEFFQSCADWEYTHDGSGTRLRTISRGFTLPDGRSYVIMWRVPEFDWKVNLPNFWLVTGSFRAD